jgi:hypothetical protein
MCVARWEEFAPFKTVWVENQPTDRKASTRPAAGSRERRGDPQTVALWRERNRHALREFWARAPADALGVKQELEKALAPDGKPTT